jgi:hypothetical protein
MEKETVMILAKERTAKQLGAMKHLLLELVKVNAINDIDREHLIREYLKGRIEGFVHLALYLQAVHGLSGHNYDQILQYGRRNGENIPVWEDKEKK